MNEHEQRIAIAEVCRWTDISVWGAGGINGKHPTEPWVEVIPDYLNDLNAMHEAEKMLWGMDWSNRYAFNDNLANTLKGRTVNRNEWDAETLLDATAAQRAEAFLRTLDLWPDDCDEAIIDPRGHEERSMM
jgi:hypothetical protein